MGEKVRLKVKDRELQLNSIDKVLFPGTGFTKAHAINYSIRVSQYLLPHLRDRPLTLKLYTGGIAAKPVYKKDAADAPSWIRTSEVWRRSRASRIHFILVNDLPSLVWSVNRYNLEMHTFLAKAPKVQQPTVMVFDLDPGEPAGILECAQVALWLKEVLEALRLRPFVKSSGSKGLHIYVPLNTPTTYEQTQGFARTIAAHLEATHPELVVSEMAKVVRSGRVFIDYSQNADFKSTAAVYSLRAKAEGPFVSMPLTWDELADALENRNPRPFFIRPDDAVEWCEKFGDLFAPVLELKQHLPQRLEGVLEKQSTGRASRQAVKKSQTDVDGQLSAYHHKRDFSRTAEPVGRVPRSRAKAAPEKERLFVIQKHAASHLHYDFRLEMQGVLRSWAVPKGPPYTKGERRLAMHVEDHPLDYARFEGIIPQGQYGGGTVMVWDIGTWKTRDENPIKAYYAGKLHLELKGKKLKGEWALVRTSRDERGRESWFLIKTGSSMRPVGPRLDDRSALTARTMARIAHEKTAEWASNRS